jgi:hypothetical protein
MGWLAKLLGKALIWILAALMPAQSVLSWHCSCPCKANTTCCGKCDHAKDRTFSDPANMVHDLNSSDEEVSVDLQPSTGWELISIDIQPCHCDSECSCQLGHEPRIGIILTSPDQANGDLVKFQHHDHNTYDDRELTRALTSLSSPHIAHERTALEICAHLCRFAI